MQIQAVTQITTPPITQVLGDDGGEGFSQTLSAALQAKEGLPLPTGAMSLSNRMLDIPGPQDVVNFVAQMAADKKWEERRIQNLGDMKETEVFAQVLPEIEGDVRDQLGLGGVRQAEPLTPEAITQLVQQQQRLETPPFQLFLDKALDFFLKVSDLERKTDMMMVDYVEGRVSLEELMIEKAKAGVAISFSLTLVNQVVQTFKEIQNMQV